MCGLIYVEKKNASPANKSVVKRYYRQKNRGSDGFGYIALDTATSNMMTQFYRSTTENTIMTALNYEKANSILFHHRWPTSTPNLAEASHPIAVMHETLKHNYYVIHNGIISNAEALKKEHEAAGFKYRTEIIKKYVTTGEIYKTFYFNDSESLAIDLTLYFEGKSEKLKSEGDIAFITLKTSKSEKLLNLFYGHNQGSPLILEKNNDFWALKSEGTGKPLKTDVLYSYDYTTKKHLETPLAIGICHKKVEDIYYRDNGGSWRDYPYHYRQTSFGFEAENDDIAFTPEEIEDMIETEPDYQDLLEAKSDIEEEIKETKRTENYDREQELKIELEGVRYQLQEYRQNYEREFIAYR